MAYNRERRNINILIALFTAVYVVSYLTRINYGAIISEMVSQKGWEKSLASLALTGSAVTYGAGQLLSGFMGDRIQPKKLIFCGLLTTMTTNLIIPFCSTPYQMTAVWCVNGLAQAFMWPPLVKLMANLFSTEDYKKASFFVSCGSSIGTVLVYSVSPVCIHYSGWRSVFFISAFFALLMAICFFCICPDIKLKSAKAADKSETAEPFRWTIVIFGIMLSVVLLGALRDGITTWMPSYLSENFNLSNEVSILSGVVLPVFSIISYYITLFANKRLIKNETALAGALFVLGFAAIFSLNVFKISSPFASVLLMATLTGTMHGASLVFTTLVPLYYKKYGRVSFVSGLFNSCTYAGSAVSTYGTAAVSEKFGWGATTVLWCMLAAFGALICFCISKKWSRQTAAEI